eukprot:TRINITY_DN927_c0_g3_i1.p2 TRINITY_DN927_c0_g3~~TRINITY_DN927_c0_g3_i1.p2  ORF type:complete len:171 (+),score=54.35 TRINITY_DN927_c0_g3_i1:85-597(+)
MSATAMPLMPSACPPARVADPTAAPRAAKKGLKKKGRRAPRVGHSGEQRAGTSSVRADDWICPVQTCNNVNWPTRAWCKRCGLPRMAAGPAEASPAASSVGSPLESAMSTPRSSLTEATAHATWASPDSPQPVSDSDAGEAPPALETDDVDMTVDELTMLLAAVRRVLDA